MDKLIENIRAALAADATSDQKAGAAAACRTLLAAFEAEPGAPLASAPAPPAPAPPPTSPIALLNKLSPDQALDLIIAKLRAAVPDHAQRPRPPGFKVQLVQVPRGRAP